VITSEAEYLVRRAEQEVQQAQAASSTRAAVAHYRLSTAYLERAAQLTAPAALPAAGRRSAPIA
jgi:hypothetical protein